MKNLVKKMTSLVIALSISLAAGIFDIAVNAATSSVADSYQSFGYNMGGSGLGVYYGQFIFLSAGSKIGYCVEISKNGSSAAYTICSEDEYKECIAALRLSVVQGKNLEYALVHGFQGTSKYGYNAVEERVATQIMVWAIVNGWFDSSTSGISSRELTAIKYLTGKLKGTSAYCATKYTSLEESGKGTYENVKACYALIKKNITNFSTKPSFDRATFDMPYNPDTHKYSVTITDANGTAALYDWASAAERIDGLSVNIVSPTKVIFTSSEEIENKEIKAEKVKGYGYTGSATIQNTNIAYLEAPSSGGGNDQDAVMPFGTDDPVSSRFTLNTVETAEGGLYVMKSSEDGLVSGVQFLVEGSDGSSTIITTNSSGVAVATDLPVVDDEDEPIIYTITEITPLDIYVTTEAQDIILEDGITKVLNFENVIKKWQLAATKRDSETGAAPQGDATLEGAVYGLYKDGSLIDTLTTDSSGSFVSGYYTCGSGYTLKEISPSTGYLLDNSTYTISGTSGAALSTEYVTLNMNVSEQVIKGKVAITKHTDDGSTQIETPEAGAAFNIYLKSSGSYAAAPSSAKDHIICDAFGYAETKNLPYGIYTVSQTDTWEGREKIADFDVNISSNGMIYRYLINNANFESYIKIAKVDAETSNVIPYEGAGFQIYNPAGELVTMQYTYPTLTTIDTFYTTADGYLITPEKLPYGSGYTLVEVAAPEGYYLDTTPHAFDVTPENSTVENALTIILVNKPDMPQKGIIKITKLGETMSNVVYDGRTYQPQYTAIGTSGAIYEITAADDIYTPDGTKRYSKDELVDTVTTAEGGVGSSIPLYLGRYNVKEITAPSGLTIDNALKTVTISYQDAIIDVFDVSQSYTNNRQKVKITINKSMEYDGKYGVGGSTYGVTFGLYTSEEMTATNGSVIPADGLIEIVEMNGQASATVRTDLPLGKYYFKELSTSSGYGLSGAKYEINFEYAGQDVEVVEVAASASNSLERGRIRGVKISEDNEPLSGVVIGLFRYGIKEYTKETAIATVETAEDGSFSFGNVPYGTYILRELTAPEGFEINLNKFTVNVGSTTEIVNNYIKGNIVIQKIDSITFKPLKGAIFEVFKDDGDGILDVDVDTLIGTMTEGDNGIYKIEGLRIGNYFVREASAPEGYIKDDNAYLVNVTESKNYTVQNSEKGFENRPMTKITDPPTPGNPPTGDNSNISLLSSIMLIGTVILTFTFCKNEKRE